MKRLIKQDNFTIDRNYTMSIYDKLNTLFHNNIPKAYILNYVTDKMLAKQIQKQGLGKPRITDTSYKDIVRRYVSKYRTLDDIDFSSIISEHNLCEKLQNDLINKFGIVDECTLNCSDNEIIQYVQSFQPKSFEIEADKRFKKYLTNII